MRSFLAWLGLKSEKKDEGSPVGQEEIVFASWNSGRKSNGIAPQLNGLRHFSFEELRIYTDNFSDSNLIGMGGFGSTYKGYLPNGVVVAIKRISPRYPWGKEILKNEIELLSRIHHKNIVSIVGFCFEQGKQLLVYEYISKGSLRDNLDGEFDTSLDWIKRLEIALDVARGLAYLLELANPQIIHRNVNSRNILLDENLNAKLISFGLSKLNCDKQEGQVSSQVKRTLARVDTGIAGTFGYLDPEYAATSQLSEKSDVYSFGVVILELITDKHPILSCDEDSNTSTRVLLVEKVKTAIDESDQEYLGLRDVIDPRIMNQARNMGLRKFMQLALSCLKETASDRPFMYEVMKEIDVILQNAGSA